METRGKNVAGGSGVNVVRQPGRSDFRYQIPAGSAIPCVRARVRIHLGRHDTDLSDTEKGGAVPPLT